ncbi:SOS response-associated peptidase [Lamprobacter modestohalophilus]
MSWPAQHRGAVIDSCTMIVTEANALLAPIHDRMPVILAPEDYGNWLASGDGSASKGALLALLKPADTRCWEAYPISRAVNSSANDSPELLEPLVTEAP